jgi:hypothetical protein
VQRQSVPGGGRRPNGQASINKTNGSRNECFERPTLETNFFLNPFFYEIVCGENLKFH